MSRNKLIKSIGAVVALIFALRVFPSIVQFVIVRFGAGPLSVSLAQDPASGNWIVTPGVSLARWHAGFATIDLAIEDSVKLASADDRSDFPNKLIVLWKNKDGSIRREAFGFNQPIKQDTPRGARTQLEWNPVEGYILVVVESMAEPSSRIIKDAVVAAEKIKRERGVANSDATLEVKRGEIMPDGFDPNRAQCASSCPRPEMCISSPIDGQSVSGVVAITGSATRPNFDRYKISLGHSDCPDETNDLCTLFESTAPSKERPEAPEGVLMNWDTASAPDGTPIRNGWYWLVLSVIDKTGNDYPEKACIRVNVNNP
jgi:hypothetical protein